MAKEVGVSRHTVHTIWKRNDLKPHRTPTFKLSKDPKFEQKFWDASVSTSILPRKRSCSAVTRKPSDQALERSSIALGIGHIRPEANRLSTTSALIPGLNSGHPCGVVAFPQNTERETRPLEHCATGTAAVCRHPLFRPELLAELVERFFADLTSDVIRDGSFRSVPLVRDRISARSVNAKWQQKARPSSSTA